MLTRELPPRLAPRLPPDHRVYAVGDVHGHSDKLQAMHQAIAKDLRRNPVAQPMLVHLGDFIDRGPDSSGTLDLLAEGPPLPGVPTFNLMGNHEWMMLTALIRQTDSTVQPWLSNGGDMCLESWGIPADLPPARWPERIPIEHLTFLRDLLLTHQAGDYLFVHAGVRPGVALAEQRKADLLWIREGFLDWDGVMLPDQPGLLIVHGHTPELRPVVRPNRLGIDTGAGKGGVLSCAVIDSGPLRFLET